MSDWTHWSSEPGIDKFNWPYLGRLEKQLEKKRQGEVCESEGEEPKRLRPDENEEFSQAKAKMSSVEGGRLFEEEQKQPEKKTHGEGCESVEEGRKRLIQEDDDQDLDMENAYYFDDGDSDEDLDDGDSDDDYDTTTEFKKADLGLWNAELATSRRNNTESKDERRCLNELVCGMLQHKREFYGEILFELFKVRLIRNEKFSSSTPMDGPISGDIAFIGPSGDIFISSYYRVSENQPDFINFRSSANNTALLPISGPNRPPLADWHSMALICHFKFNHKDVFEGGFHYKNVKLNDDDDDDDDDDGNDKPKSKIACISDNMMPYSTNAGLIPCIIRKLIGDPDVDRFLVAIYFSLYDGALATINVKILKKGVSSFSGFIYARPCVFFSRIRLLSIQKDEKLQYLDESGSVKLARSVVAVPSFSSLIIAAKLFDQDGEEIVLAKTFFPASEKGSPCKYIEGKDGVPKVKVTVDWSFIPESGIPECCRTRST